jgi:hypothetical protein
MVECGIDRAGGDMSNENVANFTACIDACTTTPSCLDVSFLGMTCYLKNVLQPPVQNAGVWGAKLVASAATTTSATNPMESTSSTSSTTSSSTSTSTSTSSTQSPTTQSPTTQSPTTNQPTTSTTTIVSTSLPSGFSSLGCFVDNTTNRVLPHGNGTSTKQTPQQCALSCAAQGYKYSGTEYASECWCGKNAPTTSAPATDCKLKCSGDSTQICGAGNRLSVVFDSTLKQTIYAAMAYGTWDLMACYNDSTSSRLLKTSVSLAAYGGGDNATIGHCMDACASKGFTYCGAEYYAECWGSNTAPPHSNIAPGADPLTAGCSYPCKGNSSEACGGSDRILVYINNGMAA